MHGKLRELPILDKATSAMNLKSEIAEAFTHRRAPQELIERRGILTPEQSEALWFQNRDWKDLNWQDWEAHSDAIYTLVPTAFANYLPSILCCSLDVQDHLLLAGRIILGVLDRSPKVEFWDHFMVQRFVGLAAKEYEVLKLWLVRLSGQIPGIDEDSLTRAYETVEILETETARARTLHRT
jgi:hypothetical protein